MGASGGVGEHPLTLLDHAIGFLRVLLVLSIWRAVIGEDEVVGGFTQDRVLTYVLLAAVFAQLLDARTQVSNSIWEGTVTTRLLRPVSVFGDYLSEMVGRWGLQFVVFSAPLLSVAPLLGIGVLPPNAGRGLAFVLSVSLSVAVGVAIDFLFAVLILKFHQSFWALRYARDALLPLLTGAVIPLSLFPWRAGEVLEWLPFASMASAPLRIYVGEAEPAGLMVLQAAWAALLWCTARWAWRRSAAKMVTVGG